MMTIPTANAERTQHSSCAVHQITGSKIELNVPTNSVCVCVCVCVCVLKLWWLANTLMLRCSHNYGLILC